MHQSLHDRQEERAPDQIKTLVHWIEAGSPRGDGPDPLAELNKQWPEWAFGEPDLVVKLPACP